MRSYREDYDIVSDHAGYECTELGRDSNECIILKRSFDWGQTSYKKTTTIDP